METKRIALSGGGWFNPDSAQAFEEATRFDGRNQISCATGSQWEHETLYRSVKGAWILRHWSQWQGSTESYLRITSEEAAAWFIANGTELPTELVAIAAEEER